MSNGINQRSVRQSNFELLRVILMFCIVCGHFLGQSGSFASEIPSNVLFDHIMGHSSRIAVNGFLILGCYFMVDKPFRTDRFLRIWLLEFIYTVVLTGLIFFMIPGSTPISSLIWAGLPIFGWNHNHWYITIYLVLCLLAPFLNHFFKLKKEVQGKALVIMFIFISFFLSIYGMEDSYLDCIGWFVFVYLFVGYYKHYIQKEIKGKYIWLGISLIIYALLVFLAVAPQYGINSTIAGKISMYCVQYLNDYKSVPNFICAMSLFIFFSKIDLGVKESINKLSSATLAVYVIHQTTAFYPFLWENILRSSSYYNRKIWPLYSMGCVVFLFIFITIIEFLRVNIIEKPILCCLPVQKLCHRIDSWYSPVDDRTLTPFIPAEKTYISAERIKQVCQSAFLCIIGLGAIYYNYAREIPILTDTAIIHLSGNEWNGSQWIEYGISGSENLFTWSEGNELKIKDILFEEKRDHHLTIDMIDIFNNQQTVCVEVNGRTLHEEVYYSAGTINVDIPSDIEKASILIKFPDAISPEQTGISGDERQLAVQLTEIIID